MLKWSDVKKFNVNISLCFKVDVVCFHSKVFLYQGKGCYCSNAAVYAGNTDLMVVIILKSNNESNDDDLMNSGVTSR